MSSSSSSLHSRWRRTVSRVTLVLCCLLLLACQILGLNLDGALLISFKHSILSDPLSVLCDWNCDDATPCSWNGVMCMGFPSANATSSNWNTSGGADFRTPAASRVIGLVLPNAQLHGSIPADLGLVEHLRYLDLSGNLLNGTIPATLFNASDLRVLTLSNNEISGELPELVGELKNLQSLNLSDNALVGRVPRNLTLLPNLTTVSLAHNYLSGELPGGGFKQLEVLDLSSNLVNGSLPPTLGVKSLRYLNLSTNRLTGGIPRELASRIPSNALIDLSFNNLTGEIPQSGAFFAQRSMAFDGNLDLCGKPLKNTCTIPSSLSNSPPNVSTTNPPAPKSPPAFAAIPKNPGGNSPPGSAASGGQGSLRPAAVVAIAVGDLAGIALLFIAFLYVYQVKKKKKKKKRDLHHQQQQQQKNGDRGIELKSLERGRGDERPPSASPEPRGSCSFSRCLRKKHGDSDDMEGASETSASSETEAEEEERPKRGKEERDGKAQAQQRQEEAILVTVDGEGELELESLLKASAYILGATGSSIVYKAVLADGTTLAVRRIGESSSIDKFKDFDAQVRSIAKLRHPNLLRIRGFYWGADEKLLIHDYAPNGSLANISFRKKLGSSPFHLNWDARLRIARGVARGLAYLHEKKCVHGNVKPSNILLGADMEPAIGDFGLERLVSGDGSYKPGTSARLFGSKRSVLSTRSLPDLSSTPGASPCGSSSISALAPPPYQAPESLKNLKPNAKWDVYSFGMVLLELIAGRVFSEVELCQWNAGFVVEERNRILRMADPALRGEVEGKEEALLSCFGLGFACCSFTPQRRPSIKDAVQALEKIAATTSSS